jgi:hypothetical protein
MKGLLVVLGILLAAAAAGIYYQMSQPPQKFTLSINPTFFHTAPGGNWKVQIIVSRNNGFTEPIDVELVNAPGWVTFQPIEIQNGIVNSTLAVTVASTAPIGPVDLTVQAHHQGH